MNSVTQDHGLGCGVACVATLLGITYQKALSLFKDGKKRAAKSGFYCKDIVAALERAGLQYEYKYIKPKQIKTIYQEGVIVLIKKSQRYPAGHYLVRVGDLWMDSWINYPNINSAKSGFRKKLPGKPIYAIYSISES
jgi:hypothetical protein